MSDAPILDLSNVINVSVLPTAASLGVPNVNTAALFTQDVPSGWGSDVFRTYKNATDVADDFGATSAAYAIAKSIFAQNPNLLLTQGYLVIIPRLTVPSLETVEEAIIRTKDLVYYFGVLMDEELGTSDASAFATLSTYIETVDKMLFYCSSTIADLQPGSVLDLVRQASKTNTRCFYYGTALLTAGSVQQTQIFAGAYLGRALSVDFGGSLTAATMHLKALSGIVSDTTVAQTQVTLAQAAGVDVYVNISGLAKLFTSGSNYYFDNVYNQLWLAFALQTAGFNYLAGTNSKIPQTEEGVAGLKDAYRKVCEQAKAAGVIAGGSWTAPDTFGDVVALRRNVSDLGYYIYSLPVTLQSQSDRESRIAPLVQIAAKLAGAVHSSNVVVNINK
jgi:hypothetical protein